MSYETSNYLPAEVLIRAAVEFVQLLGYRKFGTYERMGHPEIISLVYPLPASASGCYLAIQRLDWNLTCINQFRYLFEPPAQHESMVALQKMWPGLKQLDPEVFASNVLIPYLTSAMEDNLKSTYIALLRYSPQKEKIFSKQTLRKDHLAEISDDRISVEEALADAMAFHMPSKVGTHFAELDQKLDILKRLQKRTPRKKVSLVQKPDALVERRHALIHGMHMDIELDRSKVEALVFDVADGVALVYREINSHFAWECKLPISSNFVPRSSWMKRRKAIREYKAKQALDISPPAKEKA